MASRDDSPEVLANAKAGFSLQPSLGSSQPESTASPKIFSGRRPRPKVPEDKRKRASRACDECRKKKEKCDGRPACSRCFRYRIECRYTSLQAPRAKSQGLEARSSSGLRPETSHTEDVLSDSEKLHHLEKILAHYVVARSLTDHEIRSLANSLPESGALERSQSHESLSPTAESPQRRQHASSPCLDRNGKEAEVLEDLSLNAFTQTIKSAVNEKLPSYMPQDTERHDNAAQQEPAWDIELKQDALHAAWSCFPPRQFGRFLLDVFFRYLQTSIYYVNENWAYQCLDTYYSLPVGTAPDSPSDICTILMLMACGTQYAHLESFHLTEQMAKDDETSPYFFEDDIGQKFHRAARTLMPYVITSPSFHSVEACLMMATYNFPLDAAGASYVYLSLALSLAVQQGMHRQRYYNRLSSAISEVQKRVWWTVYILHLQASIRHGRPKFILGIEVDVDKPTDIPELRPQNGVSSFENQKGHIELMLITQSISDEIAALRKTNRSIHFLKLLSIRQQLLKWWKSFPRAYQTLNSETNPRRLRNEIHLRLYYYSTRISLGRPFLLSTFTSRTSVDGSGTDQFLGRESLVRDSIEGALEVIDLCQMLRDRVGLARASYVTEFTGCRTAMLVLLAQSLAQPDEKIRRALSRGLEIMKIMVIGNPLAKSEVRVIEVLERAVLRLEAATREKTQDPRDPRVLDKSNYDAFQTWARLWQPSSSFTPIDSSFSPGSTSFFPMSGVSSVQDSNVQPGVPSPYAENSMAWASFPLELSQFDIIPGFELDFGTTAPDQEEHNNDMLATSIGLGTDSYDEQYEG